MNRSMWSKKKAVSRCLVNRFTGLQDECDSDVLSALASDAAYSSTSTLTPGIWPAVRPEERDLLGLNRDVFEAAHVLNAMRNDLIHQQVIYVCRTLNAVGVVPVIMKGACHILNGLWPTAGARLVSDVDLVVPSHQLRRADEALRSAEGSLDSEAASFPIWKIHQHLPPIMNRQWVARVEIHLRVLRPQHNAVLTAEEIIDRKVLTTCGGVMLSYPCPMDQTLIAMLHGPLGSGGYFAPEVNMRDVLDVALLVKRYGRKATWDSAEQHLTSRGAGHIAEIVRSTLLSFGVTGLPARQPTWFEKFDAWRWNAQLNSTLAKVLGGLFAHNLNRLHLLRRCPTRQDAAELLVSKLKRSLQRINFA